MALFSRKSKPAATGTSAAQAPARPGPSRPSGSDGPEDPRIRELGEEILRRAKDHKAGMFSARFYSDKLMNWSMKDHNFKVQLFRFVDAFPMLNTPEAVHSHLADYLGQPGVKLPPGMDLGLRAGGVAKGLMTSTITSQIKSMAGKFIAGTDAHSALPGLRKLWDNGIAFSVDLLGEACVSDAEADEYRDKYLDLVNNLPDEVASWKQNRRLESDHLGEIPRVNVSVKISSLSAKCHPIDPEGAIRDVMSRLVPVLEAARDRGVFINFDMEQFELKDLTIELFKRCCEEVDFHAGIAMQAYLRSGVDDARNVADWAQRVGRSVSVRLVKGAYWDYETIYAEQQGWPCPVWAEKWQTDECFERMSDVFLDACPKSSGKGGVKLALGSHNVRSVSHALAGAERRGLPRNAVEIQMLHGMADQLKHAAAEMDLRVREYVPVGEMIPGMAYLVRRLLENTSNESWLKAGFLDNVDTDLLLARPGPRQHAAMLAADTVGQDTDGADEPAQRNGPSSASDAGVNGAAAGVVPTRPTGAGKPDLCEIAPERHRLTRAVEGVGDGRPFFSETPRDFSRREQHEAFSRAMASADVPRVANDRTPDQAREMVRRAHEAFPAWRDTDPRERARIITRAADIMRSRRDELSAIVTKENGKGWHDADADVCEAIDFCEYYARQAVPLFERQRIGRFIGELAEQWYQPKGVAAIISPWNFPLAICCGMTVAALVTGNTAVVKPAEQTPGIASVLVDILRQAGCPENVLHFCPAPGETTGAALVRDPRVAMIAFTGSKAVGLDIIQAAGITPEEQPFVKRVVCEMGGKNAAIVDTSADLDEAVLGIRASAFSFQGQKCSACSRVIVVDPDGPDGDATSLFLRRFVESARSLVLGDPRDCGTDVGHVIDDEARQKIDSYIEKGKSEAKLEVSLPVPEGLEERVGRAYVSPTIFSHVGREHAIANDEIFGPVVAVMHARSYDEAMEIANASPYKLTGGVFTRKPSHIEKAKREFRVGNLYVNRGITGSLVGRQPFGGFAMSGIGSKAGGPDYLLQFVDPRSCAENTMRRGFAPEL